MCCSSVHGASFRVWQAIRVLNIYAEFEAENGGEVLNTCGRSDGASEPAVKFPVCQFVFVPLRVKTNY